MSKRTGKAAVAILLLALMPACKEGDSSTDAGPSADQAPPSAVPVSHTLSSAGVLEAMAPQDPARPFFHDFGEVEWGEEIQWTYTLKNTGLDPVDIKNVLPACGCTRVVALTVVGPDGESRERHSDFEARPICTVPVGASVELRIDILSRHSRPNNSKLALVRLTTNSEVSPFHTLELRFLGTKPFIVAPESLTMNRIPTSHGGEAKCRVQVVKPGLPGLVHRIISAPEAIEARLEARPFAGETVWTVFATVAPLTPMGVIEGEIILAVSDENGVGEDGRVTIPVHINVGPDAFLDPGMFTFGAVPEGEQRLRQATLYGLVPGAKLEVLDARYEGEHSNAFKISHRAAGADEGGLMDDEGRSNRWIVNLSLEGSHPQGYINGELVLTLAEPVGGGSGAMGTELRARVSGVVRN